MSKDHDKLIWEGEIKWRVWVNEQPVERNFHARVIHASNGDIDVETASKDRLGGWSWMPWDVMCEPPIDHVLRCVVREISATEDSDLQASYAEAAEWEDKYKQAIARCGRLEERVAELQKAGDQLLTDLKARNKKIPKEAVPIRDAPKLPLKERKAKAIELLKAGQGIREVERAVGLHRDTVSRLKETIDAPPTHKIAIRPIENTIEADGADSPDAGSGPASDSLAEFTRTKEVTPKVRYCFLLALKENGGTGVTLTVIAGDLGIPREDAATIGTDLANLNYIKVENRLVSMLPRGQTMIDETLNTIGRTVTPARNP